VSTGATSAASQIAAGTREFQTTLANLSRERVMYFFALSLAGTLMLFLVISNNHKRKLDNDIALNPKFQTLNPNTETLNPKP
jgi:hypothetical protein